MLKGRRGAALGLAFFVGLGIFAVWSEISSHHYRSTTAPHRRDDNAETQVDTRKPDERLADYTLWLERFTGLLVLVSAIQIGFLIGADRTARRSADAAKLAADAATATVDTMIDSQRPWVGLLTVSANGPIDATVIIKNSGQTPARHMRAHFVGSIEPAGRPPPFPDLAAIPPKPLFPGTEDQYRPFTIRGLQQEHLVNLRDGVEISWVIGRIEYIGARGNACWTTICTRWDGESRRFVPHETGNDAE